MTATANPTHESLAACDHARGVCHGDGDDTVCSVEQLARLGEGTHPANTKTLEKRFAARLRAGYEEINTEIRRLVGDEDIFGLADRDPERPIGGSTAIDASGPEQLAGRPPRPPGGRRFDFLTEAEQHDRFIEWLTAAQEAGVVGVVTDHEGRFIERAYEKGTRNGESLLRRRGALPAGVDVATHGPIERRTLERIYTRAYHDLQGVTADTSRDVSRVLSEAVARGWGPDEAARAMTDRVDSVGKHQATVIARTELMHAHNEAAQETYREAGITRVEVLTAGGACDICGDLTGRTFAVDAIVVPDRTHPQCRCTVAPVVG